MDTPNTEQYTTTTTQTATPQPRFDPMTGKPLQPQPKFDPMTGKPIQPPPRFDPMTGKPIQPPPRFDPMTGKPIQPPRFDPMTGLPLQQDSHQPATPLPQTTSTPAPQNKNEFFVGINLLSKIGVIFIIIGVIAFAAVSEDFLSPFMRTAINFALGLLMVGLGEVFYRFKSVIFARALTIGGIGVLAVSILIGYHAFETINELAALLVGTIVTAGGLALGIRYRSQTITAVAVLSSSLPIYATNTEILYIIGSIIYLLLLQAAVMIICAKKDWHVPPFFSLFINPIMSGFLFLSTVIIDNTAIETAQLLCVIYSMVSLAIYIITVSVEAFRNSGWIGGRNIAVFIIATVFTVLSCLFYYFFNESLMIFGFISLFIAVAYIALAAATKAAVGSCTFIKLLLHTAIALICVSIFTIFSGDLVYIIFHICAAALLIVGYVTEVRFVKTWGIITCAFAEFYFAVFCIANITEVIYIYQFAINTLLWLIIMVALALRGIRGAGFTTYSICSVVNMGLMGGYMMIRLFKHLQDTEVIKSGSVILVLILMSITVIWFITAFIIGKLKYLGKSSYVTSIVIYGINLLMLFGANQTVFFLQNSNEISQTAIVITNAISVLAVLDLSLHIKALAPRFSRAIVLIVTTYAMIDLTIVLSVNQIVSFTNCLISIMYLAVAVIWIVWGFVRRFPLMRRFGLALTLLSSAKLFLIDFAGTDAVGRTIMFILFGIVLLVVSFIYAIFEKKMIDQAKQQEQTPHNT